MKQPVQDFLDGYNRLIFTYGVTNAGKTYTFQGTEDDIGILPRTMDMLFKSIQGRLYTAMDFKPHRCRDYIRLTRDQVKEETAIKNSILRLTKEVDHQDSTNSKAPVGCKDLEELLKGSEQSSTTAKNHVKFSLWVSFCEIYNECFYDLLIPMSNDKKRKTLRLAQDIKGCSYVKGLQWVQISDSKEAFRLLKLGLKHQSIASTKLNTFSSRSHSIFTVKILKIEDSGAPQVTRVNELSLCDLAGSERYAKTHNEGHRLKESGNINTSLLILGKCINALKNSQQSKSQQHIPFRESKLTHFLQGFFSGKGSVYMIVNISQCASTYDETLHVLKFSAIAQKMLLNLIEELKNKLIAEKKNKLLLELKIREEVMQEFAQYFAEQEIYFNEFLSYERERLQEDSDRRLEIFKELVNGDLEDMDEENELKDKPLRPGTYIDLEDVIDSLRNDVVDTKKQAEETYRYIVSLEDPQEAIGWLEKQLGKTSTELTQTKEKLTEKTNELIKIEEQLTQKTKDFEMQMIKSDEAAEQLKEATEKMNTQNKRIQELMDIAEQKDDAITRLQDLISCLEETIKDYDNTVTTIKRKLAEKNSNELIESSQFKDCEETLLKVGRKRCSENLCAKEKIIEDMRMTLEEQEQTHIKQDQVIETKLEETNRLVWELEAWKQRYRELDNQSNKLGHNVASSGKGNLL
ncbi:kinesin-like protein KIF20B [Strix uralensis]|uniref:kinesin-like protein KIF20B n=1 Tax=Strix uralensis TaxID=36305 RepID=UPI003DA247FE